MTIINTNLEKEFNLPSLDELEQFEADEKSIETVKQPVSMIQYKDLDKIEAALPQVYGLDSSDQELDELAEYGIKAYKDLLELSMNVEQRFCGEVAGASATMLGHAITAKTNKLKKRLDMVSLQIKKQLADHRTKEVEELEELDGEIVSLDRNEILNHLLGKSTQNTR